MKGARVLAAALLTPCLLAPAGEEAVREAAVAGSFYPADGVRLEKAVRAFLEEARPPRGPRPLGLLVPHAGYVFSGQILADGFRQAQGQEYDTVVILATNHTVDPFPGASVFGGRTYRTPLGTVAADEELSRALRKADPAFAYRPEAHRREHSEEVPLPFVQLLFPRARVLTAVVGTDDGALCRRLGEALAERLRERKALLVASSDLSHYPPYGEAVEADRKTLEAAVSLDPVLFRSVTEREERRGRPGLATCACGRGPVLVLLHALKALGARRGIVVSYANSGDTVFGEEDRVVGYGAAVFTAEEGPPDLSGLARPSPPEAPPPLSTADRQVLLRLAREVLERLFLTDTVPLPRPDSPALRAPRGAFVTLKEKGELRGCIGRMVPDTPLALTVARMAVQAALHDPRFSPVKSWELPSLEIEISVLTPFAPVSGPGAVAVGRDGVLLEKDGRSAVFLPQVAPEQGWNREELLGHLCEKAGLPEDCWKRGARLSTFQAEVFAEKRQAEGTKTP